ncbi:TldD/PmbA family protein [Mangrovihabitans endophyticus]|uniref:Peptidase U62 n=1 Tax=Mangrovihabitans endophyticus TaxID=1751298 RepID=A0A8J3C4A9_9ACTN|nr:metallopeptidase TldD-related protein [Mangrovihabitans endophyticus]GGL04974.1 peptidase U62 [Mangrovihabitans endophyticus]
MSELTLAGKVVELVRAAAGPHVQTEVGVHHNAEALTRFANSAIHQNVAEATTTVRLRLHLDGRTAAGSTTVIDKAGLTALVDRTLAAARMSPPDAAWPGLVPPTPLTAAASGLDEVSAVADPELRAAQVRAFVDAAGGLETAGFCRTTLSSAAFANSAGQAVEGRAVEAAMDGIARLDGADGVARLAAASLADIDGAALGARAAAKARAGGRPVELPPGRYEVVLEPAAVADMLDNLSTFGFNGKAYARGQSFAEIGAQQFDPAVTIVDEPTRGGGLPFDIEGTPRGPVTLVRDGVTAAVAHDRTSAAETGQVSTGHASPASRSWGPMALHMRLVAGAANGSGVSAGPAADSAAPLVSGVERGLLISDFWYTRVLEQKSLVITGLTRNGVWLIEDGEVTSAVGNMRFTQSYPQALAPGSVRAVGGPSVPMPDRWSGVRYTAPALHLASWHLTGNASG